MILGKRAGQIGMEESEQDSRHDNGKDLAIPFHASQAGPTRRKNSSVMGPKIQHTRAWSMISQSYHLDLVLENEGQWSQTCAQSLVSSQMKRLEKNQERREE